MPDTITDERIEAVALAIFKAEQELTADDGDKLPDRHFKVAIIVYRAMARAAIKAYRDGG
jgi:hypothetical protein